MPPERPASRDQSVTKDTRVNKEKSEVPELKEPPVSSEVPGSRVNRAGTASEVLESRENEETPGQQVIPVETVVQEVREVPVTPDQPEKSEPRDFKDPSIGVSRTSVGWTMVAVLRSAWTPTTAITVHVGQGSDYFNLFYRKCAQVIRFTILNV